MSTTPATMNESELRKHATCAQCRNKVLHTGLPLFWRLTVERGSHERMAALNAAQDAALLECAL